MHEHKPRQIAPVEGSSDRSFGLVFTVFFLIIGLLPALHGDAPRMWALAFATAFLVAALVIPSVLAPLNRLWAKFGLLLHSIASPVALGILFYGVVTPTGLLRRLFAKDPLRLRLDKNAESYWIVRTPPGPTAESLKNQF